MFFPPAFFIPERMIRAKRDARVRSCVDRSPAMKWSPELNLRASTYSTRRLFDVEQCPYADPNRAVKEQLVLSPSGQFCYMEKVLPAGNTLYCYSGRRVGTVLFDGPVTVPVLHERKGERWNREPWMSHTPQEVFTLRAGTHMAKSYADDVEAAYEKIVGEEVTE